MVHGSLGVHSGMYSNCLGKRVRPRGSQRTWTSLLQDGYGQPSYRVEWKGNKVSGKNKEEGGRSRKSKVRAE